MKSKKIIYLLLVVLITVLSINIKSYAITLPWPKISSYNYSNGDKMTQDEKKDVEVEKTLQLYVIIGYGNDLYDPDHPDSMGWYVQQTDLSDVTWTSSNTSVATVDNNGKVTGVATGKTTITAKYNNETANYEVNVISNTEKTSFYVTMKVGTEGGSITSEQGLVGGATSVEKGKDLKIYICPDEGYEIDKVLVDNKAIDLKTLVYEKNNPNAASEDGVAVYTFTNVSKDYTIEAYYKKKSNSDLTKSPVNPGNSSEPTNPSSSDSPITKSDSTSAPTILPKTGENVTMLIFGIIAVISISVILYKKYKNYNEIK